jgi:carboxyl-terminal processing protease
MGHGEARDDSRTLSFGQTKPQNLGSSGRSGRYSPVRLDLPSPRSARPGSRACYRRGMNPRPRWTRTALLVLAAFAGGAVTSHFANATTQSASLYAPFDQLAYVLTLVEKEYVDPTQRTKVTEGAIKGMVAELDPHSAYMNPSEYTLFQEETAGKFGGIGVEVDFRNDYVTVIAPIEGSPAARAGVRSGDQISAIDGHPTRGERVDKLVSLMRGVPGSAVRMTVRRAGVADPITYALVREVIHVTSVAGKRLDGNVAYIRLKQFQEGTHDELLRAAAKLRAASKTPLYGVILDMRNNPGGLVDEAEAVADEFLASGVIYTTRHRGKIIDEAKAHDGGAFAALPVVVLVNEYSASSAELVAGALQDSHRATVVGAPTFGKGSVQTIFHLPGSAGIRLTTMRYYTPNGRSIQAEGVRPDLLIQAAQPSAPGEVMRERDLEGHLPAERTSAPVPPSVQIDQRANVVVDTTKAPADAPALGREVPTDPTKGNDFALSVGYQLLLKNIRAPR